ncbi:hypothetical protein AB0K00_17200 [Dactylosporangium sp. NPDC049525]|uniref:hypothetical protein n=1 Tax=Dactylosporangium sp. NPDC049525 TaxID=3154730 RepID=UPI00344140D7
MFARLQTTAARPADGHPIADMIAAHPGFAGLAMLTGEDGGTTMISLWLTREDAESASDRSAATRGPRLFELTHDEIFEVDADQAGSATGEQPAVAFLGEFDGPLSPARVEAARFAGTERIGPALREVAGVVRLLVLWHPTERRMAVLHLAVSPAALHAISRTVVSSQLLPGEDPELLPGPDRVSMLRVAAYRAATGTGG